MRLPNGYGSVYKLSGNRRNPWIVRITMGFDDEGNQIRSTIGYYPTRQKALQTLAEFNDNPYDLELSKVTFAEIYQRWYNDEFNEDSNRSTVRNYQTAFKHCSPLHDMKMSDIRPNHMQAIIDGVTGGYQTQKRIHILCNKLYDWCIKHDCIKKNYAKLLVINSKSESAPRNAFTYDEIQKLWNNLKNNEYISIILMLIYSGLRINELLDLQKEDVNLEEQYFKVKKSKTDAGIRIVPIADKVLPFWKTFFEKSKCEYAVCTVDGQRMNYDNFKRRYWQPLMTQLNLQHTIHETRHTFISLMVQKNINQTIIKKIVGHKSIMNLTERVYTHIEISELLDAVNKI